MPQTDLGDAARVVEEITVQVRGLSFEHGGVRLHVTLSAGLVESDPLDPVPQRSAISELMGRADDLLYEAKHQGRDRVVWSRLRAGPADAGTAAASAGNPA